MAPASERLETPAESCFSEEFVTAIVQGTASPEDMVGADTHMDACDRCRQLVAEAFLGSRDSSPGSSSEQGAAEKSGPVRGTRPRHLETGEVLANRYRVLELLGHGATGTVYRVRDETLEVDIAVKVLKSTSSGTVKRLQKEIVLGRRITHPNVCRVYDLGEHDGFHFITMEYLQGETLRAHLQRGFLRPWEAWNIVDQIGKALEVAHQHGIIHRDLKPENIMVAADGKVTVMDFGLAADLQAELPRSQGLVGTPAYWAPEQARGEGATMSSDIYAIMVIYCELLGGGRPGWGEQPNLLNSGKPFERIAQKALSVDPADRYENIPAIREDLDKAWAEIQGWESRTSQLRQWAMVAGVLAAALATVLWVLL